MFACLVGGCGRLDGAASSDDAAVRAIQITGSSTIAPVMAAIAKRYESRHPGVRIEVQTGGSSRGVADARSGLSDIGMVSRALKPDESDLQDFAIARDGVCVILHADNPVAELSKDQVIGIYTGTIENWNEVDGPDAPITVVNKAAGRSTLEVFADHFELDHSEVRADVIIGDNQHGIKTVAGNPHAIGYVSIGTAEFARDSGTPIRLLPTDGVEASVRNVATGSYPIARPLNLVSSAPPSGVAAELIEFARSSQVHDIIEELSFVPIEN